MYCTGPQDHPTKSWRVGENSVGLGESAGREENARVGLGLRSGWFSPTLRGGENSVGLGESVGRVANVTVGLGLRSGWFSPTLRVGENSVGLGESAGRVAFSGNIFILA